LLKIRTIGHNYTHEHGIKVDRPNGTKSLLFLCFKTPVEVLSKGELVFVNEPAFILYDKEVPQYYKSDIGPYINDFIHFKDEDDDSPLYALLNKLNIPLNTLMYVQGSQEISAYIKDISLEFRQSGNFHEDILEMKLKTLLYKFSDVLYTEKNLPDKLNRYRESFTDIRNSIYNFSSFDPKKNVNELAKSLNISTSYFQHIYKQLFDVPVMQDIIKARIEYACYQLNSASDSIADVAAKCGYENQEHFTRQFKEVIGKTPNQYRKSTI